MDKKLALIPLILVNLIAALYGFIFFYGSQFLSTPIHLWIFIPDCPLYALLAAIALAGFCFGKKNDLFNSIVFIGLMKYGFWTVFVLSSFQWFYFAPETSLMYSILFAAHLGLFLEAFLFIGHIKLNKLFLGISLAWFLLNDFIDYLLAVHPPIPLSEISFIFQATIIMSIAFTGIAFLLLKKIKKPLLNII